MNGIAVCWPARSKRIATIAATGRVPLYCHPRKASVPGSPVALVSPDGRVLLRFRIRSIDGPKSVHLADGKRLIGYELVAKQGTIRSTQSGSLGTLAFQWRVLGQLRYFDPAGMRPIIIDEPKPGGSFLPGASLENSEKTRFKPYTQGIPDLPPGDPEARLVSRYVRWIGAPSRFTHAQPLARGGYTDLFNLTTWTLFEAKARSDDRTIREAFGQLYYYRRSFTRSPSLAILVPSAPRPGLLAFLAHFGVAAVWRQSSGAFTDSVHGRLTRELRASYRARSIR